MPNLRAILIIVFTILCSGLFAFFFFSSPPEAREIKWGVNFSQKHAELLGLDWQETYLALLDDLAAKRIKVIGHWDSLEPEKDKYYFEDLDWQLKEAEKKGVKLMLVVGMKTPRWPECHIPEWAENLSKEEQQKEILELIKKVVLRYRSSESIWAWQVENEPFFPFGVCPWSDEDFLRKEVELVKVLDKRPVIISDSGEGSFWIRAAKIGDIVSSTMYKRVWHSGLNRYITYPFPETFYYAKSLLIEKIFGKKVICGELQAEPWGPVLLYNLPLEEQEKTMDLEKFRNIIAFSKKTGLDEFYLWGAEWWFWLKEEQNKPEVWEEAKKLF